MIPLNFPIFFIEYIDSDKFLTRSTEKGDLIHTALKLHWYYFTDMYKLYTEYLNMVQNILIKMDTCNIE